jgi:CRISPR-associated protein Csm1
MSLQVFLQAQLFGSEQFLGVHSTQIASSDSHSSDVLANDLVGRCAWLTLLCEILPRALLSELKLSRMLLGSSSAEQFLLVLAEEDIPRANEFLNQAAAAISQLSADTLRLVWTSTENLGAWPVARKRLDDALQARVAAPLSHAADIPQAFAPFETSWDRPPGLSADLQVQPTVKSYFVQFAEGLAAAKQIGWSASNPAHLTWDSGDYTWPLTDQTVAYTGDDAILFPRRAALDDNGHPATLAELAARAEGANRWGVLRGDVDHFDAHLRRANSIEEHIHLSVLFKEFFAGELALLCTLPDFWRKVTILYRGGDDFAVAGAWDALVLLAREIQRLFEKFIEQNAASFPGLEARTISMSLSIAPEIETPLAAVFLDAGAELRTAKSTEPGSFHLFGRTLEWKRLADAEELKAGLIRLVKDFKFSPAYINDLASVYREAFSARASRRGKPVRVEKPWRTYVRLTTIIPQARGKELNNVRNAIITNLVGKRTTGLKLRPSARVGLEWARLAAGSTF